MRRELANPANASDISFMPKSGDYGVSAMGITRMVAKRLAIVGLAKVILKNRSLEGVLPF